MEKELKLGLNYKVKIRNYMSKMTRENREIAFRLKMRN